MNEPIIVNEYGVHFLAGNAFLHQQKGGEGKNVFSYAPSPFHVTQRSHAPHRIDPQLFHLSPLPEIPKGFLNNKLVDLYLPRPIKRGESYIIRVSEYECFEPLEKLAQLGSPVGNVVRLWTGSKATIETDLSTTNLVPLTILGWSLEAGNTLSFIINLTRTKRRNFIASVDALEPAPGAVDLTEEYHTMLPMLNTLSAEDLKIIGTHFFMRHLQKTLEAGI